MNIQSKRGSGGLRRRWLINTAGVVFALGLVCVMAVTASFAAYYYSNMQSDMEDRAERTTEFFANYLDQNYNSFYQSCITYAQTFEDRNILELQFINNRGDLVASSYGPWAGQAPSTPEIQEAVSKRGHSTPYDSLAQLAEHLTFNQGVRSSNLRWVTTKPLK